MPAEHQRFASDRFIIYFEINEAHKLALPFALSELLA